MAHRVLICDDEIHILRAAEIKLTRSGFQVECARDGQEAWEAIERNPPDILITDLQMPRMDGLELSRRVRQNPATKNLPVLMLTAKGFEHDHREEAEQRGVSAIISKPFSPRELVRTVEIILNITPGAVAAPVACPAQAPYQA